MCGIIGISAENNVAEEIYESLLMLQHRGQDAAGMVVCEPSGKLNSRKSKGYVRDVFQQNQSIIAKNLERKDLCSSRKRKRSLEISFLKGFSTLD